MCQWFSLFRHENLLFLGRAAENGAPWAPLPSSSHPILLEPRRLEGKKSTALFHKPWSFRPPWFTLRSGLCELRCRRCLFVAAVIIHGGPHSRAASMLTRALFSAGIRFLSAQLRLHLHWSKLSNPVQVPEFNSKTNVVHCSHQVQTWNEKS